MTKNQHIQNLMASTPKLNKKSQEEMELLLNEYKSTKASNKENKIMLDDEATQESAFAALKEILSIYLSKSL